MRVSLIAVGRMKPGPEKTIAGEYLARAEALVSLNRMFDRTSNIRISEKVHGPAGARRYSYLPTFILRGLTHINLEFDPVTAPVPETVEGGSR